MATFTTAVDACHRVSNERFQYIETDLPASALIGAKRLAHPDLVVEMEKIAAIAAGRANS